METHRVVRLPVLCTGHPLPPGRFLVLISVGGRVNPRSVIQLEGLGQLKNPMTPLGIKPITFQLVAQCLNQLLYSAPLPLYVIIKKWNRKYRFSSSSGIT
jgi:hypothetical protein